MKKYFIQEIIQAAVANCSLNNFSKKMLKTTKKVKLTLAD